MSARYTPGPWAYSTSQEGWSYTIHIHQSDNAAPTAGWSDVGYITQTCTGDVQSIQEANARLIAAAPDLIEALKMFVWPHQETDRHTEKERQEIGRAAIAMALGDQA